MSFNALPHQTARLCWYASQRKVTEQVWDMWMTQELWSCRSWQGISHPMNSNPFPASFLNFKGQFQLARVYIPGNQTFMVG